MDHGQMGAMRYWQLIQAVWLAYEASLWHKANPSLIISTRVAWRWPSLIAREQLSTRVHSRTATFVLPPEPEPIAIFSLQSWSVAISKAIAAICICLCSLSHFLVHWTRTEPIWSVARCHPMFFFSWLQFDIWCYSSRLILSQTSRGIYSRFLLLHFILWSAGLGGGGGGGLWQMRMLCNISSVIVDTWHYSK